MQKFIFHNFILLLLFSCDLKNSDNNIEALGLKWVNISEHNKIAIPANTCFQKMLFNVRDSIFFIDFSSPVPKDYKYSNDTKLKISIGYLSSNENIVQINKQKFFINHSSSRYKVSTIKDSKDEFYAFSVIDSSKTVFYIRVNKDKVGVYYEYYTRKPLNIDSMLKQMDKMINVNTKRIIPMYLNLINDV